MPRTPASVPARGLAVVVAAALSLAAGTPPTRAADVDETPPSGSWTVIRRAIGEGRGHGRFWQVDYTLRNDGATARTLRPEDVSAVVSGTVSNSRVPSHARPNQSRVVVSAAPGLSASCDVIPSADDARRCREHAVLQVWPADKGPNPPEPAAKPTVRLASLGGGQGAWTIAPGGTLRVRLKLEHDHFLYGPHDALLGPRTVELTVGAAKIKDRLALDRETDLPRKALGPWPGPNDPPADRLDARVFVSAPDSLHIEAHVPGNQSYRFKECPVRYATKMRLRYWYLIAPGTEGDAKALIVQYRESPTAWKSLSDGDVSQTLSTAGRWVKVEKVFRTEPEATSLTLEFRLPGDVGEMWIDDVSLEPVEDGAGGP